MNSRRSLQFIALLIFLKTIQQGVHGSPMKDTNYDAVHEANKQYALDNCAHRCAEKMCVPKDSVCDDIKDCDNGSDEKDCGNDIEWKDVRPPNAQDDHKGSGLQTKLKPDLSSPLLSSSANKNKHFSTETPPSVEQSKHSNILSTSRPSNADASLRAHETALDVTDEIPREDRGVIPDQIADPNQASVHVVGKSSSTSERGKAASLSVLILTALSYILI